MRILVTGASGYVGSAIAMALASTHEVIGTSHKHEYSGLVPLNITNPGQVEEVISSYIQPDVIVHCAALVDGCEESPARAHRINVEGTQNILTGARAMGALVAFLSTASVFDAREGAFSEDDAVSSQTVYGRTKIEAEQLILGSDLPSLILRPALVVGPAPRGTKGRFFGKLIHAVKTNTPFAADNTWRLTPTWNRHLADVIAHWIDGTIDAPLLHVACPEVVTKYALGRSLAREVSGIDELIIPTTTLERLPSILNAEKLAGFGLAHPSLLEMARGIAQEISEHHDVYQEQSMRRLTGEERE